MPTRGAANPPTRNCEVPSRAEALPARDGCPASARVVAAGSTNPTPQTVTNRPGTSAHGPARAVYSARRGAPAAGAAPGAPPTSRPATCVAATIPTELTANTPLNACGL